MAQEKKLNTVTEPKRVMKGMQSFMHDLFKLEVSNMKRNVSYKKFQPQIEEVEHAHFFHSHDTGGNRNEYCVPVGGHFHKMQITTDKEGQVHAVCGPALKEITTTTRAGTPRNSIVPVSWVDEALDKEIVDTHTHDVAYKGSEEIWPDKVKRDQAMDAAKLSQLNQNYTPKHAPALTELGDSST